MRQKEQIFKNGENRIFGILYLPGEKKEAYPTVILSHGFNGNHMSAESYAKMITEAGFALYAYDFCGGGVSSKSDGDMTKMTVLTEAADLNAVFKGISALEEVDEARVFLFGESQGGFVSSYVAAELGMKVKGLILHFPAFVLQDDARKEFPEGTVIPETYEVMGAKIGKQFAIDAMSFDIFDVIGKYKGDVLIVHGDADRIVPIAYSERAAQIYEHAELKVIPGADHGFVGEEIMTAGDLTVAFLKERADII